MAINSLSQPIQPGAGETDVCLRQGVWVDSADPSLAGRQILSGSIYMPDGTNGGILSINITTFPAGTVIQTIELLNIANGQKKTVASIPNGGIINGVGEWMVQFHPDAAQGSYDFAVGIAVPNQSQVRITMADNTHPIVGWMSMQSTW